MAVSMSIMSIFQLRTDMARDTELAMRQCSGGEPWEDGDRSSKSPWRDNMESKHWRAVLPVVKERESEEEEEERGRKRWETK